jgi:chemotaxis protein MotB
MSDANTREPNLLIIRRGGSAELETPKGGVWKIAYADFMTAMMAFFLVMWLINATSETTKTGVANYFNPIKLASGTQLPKKGLQDPEEGEHTNTDEAEHEAAAEASPEPAESHEAEAAEAEHASSEKKARFTEEALFRDPYAVLAAIAAEAEGTTSLVGTGRGGSGGAGDRMAEIYGDPFDPAAWQVTAAPSAEERPLEIDGDAGETAAPGAVAQGGTGEAHREGEGELPAASAATEMPHRLTEPLTAALADEATERPASDGASGEGPMKKQAHAGDGAKDGASEGPRVDAGESASSEQAADGAHGGPEAMPLQKWIAEALASGSPQMPSVTVTNADGGVLISLADQVAFGMFAVGSAEPLPETIAVMEKIASLLNTLPGRVIIRGHTDGRPFRSGDYDNWRLSSARAHMAYHMLVRGGLDESRVERIEGYADRDLKLPDDPDAAENRRIDILVQEVHS